MKRNPFFLSSGFKPQEAMDIIEAKSENKNRLDKIKERKQREKKSIKHSKQTHSRTKYETIIQLHKKMVAPTKVPKTDQIQYSFDIAKWLGEQHED